ncbi:hypothetical protein AAU61_13760 [Desulfocarbo indianensis]|nr:hypothetical protein AAU61_13760 [Desulfocarbo indianensis]
MTAQAAQPEYAGYILEVRGQGRITSKALARDLPAQPQAKLYEGDVVWAGPRSEIRIVLSDDSLLQLGADSRLTISRFLFDAGRETRDAQMELLVGKVRALVNDLLRGRQRKFEVRTPTAVAAVRGTLFLVWAPAAGQTTVLGYDNPVQVRAADGKGAPVTVSQGTFTKVAQGAPPTAPALPNPAQGREFQGLFQGESPQPKGPAQQEGKADQGPSFQLTPGSQTSGRAASPAGLNPGSLAGSPPGSLAGTPPGSVAKSNASGRGFPAPGQSQTPPGQDKDQTPPGQDKTPPGQDKDKTPPGQDKTPPGQDKDKTPPGQDKTPPGQDKDKTPPGQDKTPPGQDKDKTPPGQDKTPPGQDKTPPGQDKKK